MSGGFVGIDTALAGNAIGGFVGLEGEIEGYRDRVQGVLEDIGCLEEHGAILDAFDGIKSQSETARGKLMNALAGMMAADAGWLTVLLNGPLGVGAALTGDLQFPDLSENSHLAKVLQEMTELYGPELAAAWYAHYADLITAAPDMSPQELGAALNEAYQNEDKDAIRILSAAVCDDLNGKDEKFTKQYLKDMGNAWENDLGKGTFRASFTAFTDDSALFMIIAAAGIPDNDYILERSQKTADVFFPPGRVESTAYSLLEMFGCISPEYKELEATGITIDVQGEDQLDAVLGPMQGVLADALLEYCDNYVRSPAEGIELAEMYGNGEFFGEGAFANEDNAPLNRPLARAMTIIIENGAFPFLKNNANNHTANTTKIAEYLSMNLSPAEIDNFYGNLYAATVYEWEQAGYPDSKGYNEGLTGDSYDILRGLRSFSGDMETALEREGVKFGWSNVMSAGKFVLAAAEYVPLVGTAAKYANKGISMGEKLVKSIPGSDDNRKFQEKIDAAERADLETKLDNEFTLSIMAGRDARLKEKNPGLVTSTDVILQAVGAASVEDMTPSQWEDFHNMPTDENEALKKAYDDYEKVKKVIVADHT